MLKNTNKLNKTEELVVLQAHFSESITLKRNLG
jgi:hypothetical protein